MKLIQIAIIFLAISSSFEGKKKKKKKKSEQIERPEGMGTDKTPNHCIVRGIANGIQPNLNGDHAEWLAAVCPGIMGRDKPKKKKKTKKKKKKHSLERRSLKDESLFETCMWSMEHGSVCQRCHDGDPHLGKGVKKYPNKDINLNGCATRYKYEIVNWPRDSGPQQKSFLEWIKGQDTSNLPDKQILDNICPGVFDDPGDGSKDSTFEACMWGWKMGTKMYGSSASFRIDCRVCQSWLHAPL